MIQRPPFRCDVLSSPRLGPWSVAFYCNIRLSLSSEILLLSTFLFHTDVRRIFKSRRRLDFYIAFICDRIGAQCRRYLLSWEPLVWSHHLHKLSLQIFASIASWYSSRSNGSIRISSWGWIILTRIFSSATEGGWPSSFEKWFFQFFSLSSAMTPSMSPAVILVLPVSVTSLTRFHFQLSCME